MQCIRIPRRWIRVLSALLALHVAGLALVGASHAGDSEAFASPDQRGSSSLATSAMTGDPVIASLPFERGVGGDLVPDQQALKALLTDSARNPGGLLVIRPSGELAGFDRRISTDGNGASQADSNGSPGRPGLEEGSAALLHVIHALRAASPECRVSVLGLPLERSPSADRAAAADSPYGELLHQLDAFVSTRGLLQTRGVGDEQAWLKGAMPAAVRLANGRPILFRTPTGWQQRTLAIEPHREGDAARAAIPADSGPLAAAIPATRSLETTPRSTRETIAHPSAMGERDQAPFGADGGGLPFDPPASAGMPDGHEDLGGFDETAAPSIEPLRGAMLSETEGPLPSPAPAADPEKGSSDEAIPDLASGAVAGGAVASPRSFAILPRAFRAFAPLAIGGDLLTPRNFSSPEGPSASADSASAAPTRPTSASSTPSLQTGSTRSATRPSNSSAPAAGAASGKTASGRSSAVSPSRAPASSASPAIATGASAAISSPSTPVAKESNAPASPAPPRPAPAAPTLPAFSSSPSTPITTESNAAATPAPPRADPPPPTPPAASSSNSSGSLPTSAPPTVNPVIPITPPTGGASGGSTSSTTSTASGPQSLPRDWSDIPDNTDNSQSHIGSHISTPTYYNSSIAFANLIYSSISELDRLPQGRDKNAFGLKRFLDWSGPPYFTEDGWPYRNDNGPLSLTNSCDIYLVLNGRERLWSALGLSGGYSTPPTAEQTGATKVAYTIPEGIAGRSFTFDVTCYWEGTGTAVASAGRLPSDVAVSTVVFSGPDGKGPFGDGPRRMSMSTRRFGAGVDRILAHIVSSDATGVDPLRNLIVLVSNVRDSATGELIYAGFDHTTYRPFQLYPQFIESMRHFSHIRSLATQWQHHEPNGARVIFDDTGLLFECIGEASMPLVTTGWDRTQPSAPGFKKGFAAINRPTNVAFGNSLRAYIEICNQLDADLWWCHPVPTVVVGTRAANGSITYARLRGSNTSDPHQVGRLLADEAYVRGFADEIDRHLKPGLRVYSEWGNEVWNWSPTYWHGTAYAWSSALRAIASVEYGGDDGLWFSKRTLESPAIHAGVQLKADANVSMAAFSAAASALLAERIRVRLGPNSDREIICVAAGQSAFLARSSNGLGQLWAAMPKLFKQLDAVAHAPYRSWWSNGAEYDTQLAEVGYSAVWDEIAQVRGALLPYALTPGGTLNPDSFWGTRSRSSKGDFFGYPHQRSWKNLALDRPEELGLTGRLSYARAFTPPGWPSDRRRWNLDLICYEGGNHHIPRSTAAKLESFPATMHPNYRLFNLRYMEMIFGHGPKGLTRDPASASEDALYRPGMVPLGIVEDAEPLHDRFTFLNTTGEPSFRHGMFWPLQWWNGHVGAPQADGVKDAVRLGIGTDLWWE